MEYIGLLYYHSPKQVPSLDVLHNSKFDMLRDLILQTGVNPEEIDYNDPKVYQLFKSGDIGWIPEFDTQFARAILNQLSEFNFSTLLHVCGMLHGTNVWNENAEQLISDHPFSELICVRESVFWTLQKYGIDRDTAFQIMEDTRKGRFLANAEKAERWLKLLCDSNVPLWYIDSLSKIRYLTTRAHVAHYTKLAVTMAWFKVHYPEEFCNAVLNRADVGSFSDLTKEELHQKLNEWKGTLVSKTF